MIFKEQELLETEAPDKDRQEENEKERMEERQKRKHNMMRNIKNRKER